MEKPVEVKRQEVQHEGSGKVEEVTVVQEVLEGEKLQMVLEEIMAGFKQRHKNLEIAVLKQPFEIKGESLNFILHGELQIEIFSKLKPELTGLLRRKLSNPRVEITFESKEEAINPANNLYTSSDKLNYLKEKSPALKELQRRFGLETDF